MSSIMRGITIAALAVATAASAVAAQTRQGQNRDDVWYFGGQGGVHLFRTPSQTQAGIVAFGGNVMIKAKRGGLLLSVDQSFGDNETSRFLDSSGTVDVLFDGIRRYQAVLMAFPANWNVDPYFGAGVGIMQTTGTRLATPAPDPFSDAILQAQADDAGSTAYGTLLLGMQIRANRFVIFGEGQIQTKPGSDKLIRGSSYALQAGLRIGLGGRKYTNASR